MRSCLKFQNWYNSQTVLNSERRRWNKFAVEFNIVQLLFYQLVVAVVELNCTELNWRTCDEIGVQSEFRDI